MYLKNKANQSVWAQINSRTDGAPITADVTVKVASAGLYADGTGTLTHRGGGLWEYVFAQAETNFDQFAYQFNHASGVAVGGTIVPMPSAELVEKLIKPMFNWSISNGVITVKDAADNTLFTASVAGTAGANPVTEVDLT